MYHTHRLLFSISQATHESVVNFPFTKRGAVDTLAEIPIMRSMKMDNGRYYLNLIIVFAASIIFILGCSGCGGGDEEAKEAEAVSVQQAELNQRQEEDDARRSLLEAPAALLWNAKSSDRRSDSNRYDWSTRIDDTLLRLKTDHDLDWDELPEEFRQQLLDKYEEIRDEIDAAAAKAAAKVEAEAPSALLWNTSDGKGRLAWEVLYKEKLGYDNLDPGKGWDDLSHGVRQGLMKTYEDYLILKTAKEEASKRETAFQDRVQSAERLFPDNHKTVVDMARHVNFIEEFEDSPAHFLINLLLEMRAYKEYYAQNPPEDRGAIWYTFYYKVSGRQRNAQLNRSMFNYFLKFIEERVENSSYKNALDATAQLHDLCSKKSEVGDIELAIENDALVNVRQIDSTPLMLAIKNENDSEVLLKLLELGSSLNVCDGDGNTPLMLAINHGYDKDFISKLLSMGAIAKSRNNSDEFPIVMAVTANDKEIVSLLLQSYKCSNPNCGFYSDVFFNIEKPDWAQDLMCPECDEPARKNQIMSADGSIERVNLDSISGQQKDIGINSTMGDLDRAISQRSSYYGRRYKWSEAHRHSWGMTPLIEAVFNDEVDVGMISHLVKAGADINHLWNVTNSKPESSSIGAAKAYTPFQLAIEIPRTKSLEKIIALIDSGADVLSPMTQKKAEGGWFEYAAPLMIACQRQTKDVVSTLLENYNAQGVLSDHINITDANERTALCYAAEYNESPEIITELIKYGADINKYSNFEDRVTGLQFGYYQPVKEFLTPLMLAAKSNNAEVVKILIENGSDVNSMTRQGKTALMFAAHYNTNDSVCSELINSGAKVNGVNPVVGLTPLMYASIHNDNPDIISTLVEAGASVDYRATEIDLTAIDKNAGYGDQYGREGWSRDKSIEYEIYFEQIRDKFDYANNGLAISTSPVKGMTPLMFASRWNSNPEIAKRLLQHGSDIHAVDKGFSPIHHAAQHNPVPEVVKVLISAGANLNSRSDARGNVPVLLAGSSNNASVCSELIDAGADITATYDTRVNTTHGPDGDILTLFDIMERNEFINGTPLYNKIRDLQLADEAR